MSQSELPLVSILAVSYNHADYCIEALESIRKQTYPNIQLVIIDDCSQDNTVEIINNWIKEYNVDCKFIAHSDNKGTCSTYNEGVSYCTGKYYSTLSCDDILLPEKTAKQVELIESLGNKVGMVYSDAEMFFEDDPTRTEKFIGFHRQDDLKPEGDIFGELLDKNFLPAMSCLIRKDAFTNLGGFDEELLYEDYDFFLRLSKSYKVNYLDSVFVKYRMHDSNWHINATKDDRYLVSRIKMFLKHSEIDSVKDIIIGHIAELQSDKKKLLEKNQLLIDDIKITTQSIHNLNKAFHKRFSEFWNKIFYKIVFNFPLIGRVEKNTYNDFVDEFNKFTAHEEIRNSGEGKG